MVKKQKSVNESHSNNSADQSERWYRMVLDSANDAVLVYSRTSEGKLNKFVDVNKAACDLYGYSREEFLGISPIDISASKNVGYYRKQQEQSTFGQKLVVESVHLTKDGREIPVEISRSLFEIDGRHVVVSVVRDISKRKRELAQLEDARIGLEQRVAERTAQLAASGERITDLISTMHNAVYVYRAVNNANDFVFSEFNHAAEIMEGCSRQEVIGKNLTEVSPRVKESGLIEALRRVYKTGKPEHYPPSIYKDPRGGPDTWREAWLYKLNSGEIVAEYNDATERMRAEGAYQTLVENTLQGLLILQDERIVFANQALVQMSGYTMDELLGLSPEAVRDLVHPDDQGFVFRRAQERLDGKSVPPQYEFRFVRKDGELRWVEQYASVIEYGGRPAAQATYIDITERKKAEESLRTEKEFSDKILNAGQDTVFVFDPASGKALRWNESFAKKSGYSNEQIAEMKAPDSWYSKQDIEKASIYINQIMQGNVPSPIELSLIAKDGTLVPTEYVATVIKGDEGEPLSVIAVGRDITERKLAEQELRTSQERIRAILDASPDVIHLIDINGIILASNKSFAERVGLEIDDVIGTSVFDYGTPESAHRRKIAIDKVFSTGKPVQLEDEGLTGTYESYIHPVFNPAGEILAVAVYARDITERKQAEQELLDSEAKFKTISHGSLQGIVITKDQTIAYANPAFEALFGYTMEELNAFNSQQRIERTYVDDRERIAKYHQERFEGKDVPESIEYRIVRKDETVRWVESRSSMIEYLGGQAILSVCVDTTERKQAEEEIRKLGSAVDQSIDGIAMSDLEPKLTFVNQAFAGMHGYTVEEMMGMKVENIHSKEQRQEFAGRVGQIQQEGSWAGEIGHVRKDGSIFPTFMTTTLIRDEKGDPTGIMVFARDITGLKQAEEEIKKLGSAVDQSIDGIAINDRTHKIVYANETYAAMHGYSPQELKELSFRDLIPGDGGDIWPAIRQSVTTKDSWSGEIDHLKKDGTTFPSYISITKLKDDDGKQIGVLSICRDITERKQAEEKLRENERNLKGAQALAHMGHWKLNPLTQEIEGSDELFRIFGITRQEATLEAFIGVVHPDDREYDLYHIRRGMELGEPWDIEHRLICKDGTEKYVHAIGEVIKDDIGKVAILMGTIQDITERKQAEEEIRNLSAAIEQSIGGVAMASVNKKLTYVNPAYANMHGYGVDEMIGMEIRQLNHSDYVSTANKHVKMIQKQGWAVYESEHIRKDGSLFMVKEVFSTLSDESSAEKGYLLIADDITERKQAEAKLKDYSENLEQLVKERAAELADSEEKFRLIVNSTNDAIYVSQRLGDGNIRILEVNQALCDMLGYTREELLKMLPRDMASARGADISQAVISRLDTEKHVVYESEFLSKVGKKIAVEISVRLFNYKGVRTLVSVIRDIADRKESQRKLEDVQQKMLRSEKLAAIGQMASGIAHELRNPLAIVNNAAYYIKLKMGGADETLDKHLAIMEKEIFRSSSIIAGLLDFARTREPQLRAIGLNEFVSRVIYGLSIPHEMTLIFEAAPDEINLSVDTEQIKRVLINMVNNAVNAMPKGGELSIVVKAGKEHAEIHITDTGVGISHGNLRKIFDPLFTTRSAEGGTGIGLSICKSIIKAHRGDIKVKSTVGKGSTFTIRLPIS